MERPGSPQFEARVQIGTTWRWIDHDGTVTIADGFLTLSGSSSGRIAWAPVGAVHADKPRIALGAGARIWIDGEAYMIEAPSLNAVDILTTNRELVDEFFAALQAAGGHLGKP